MQLILSEEERTALMDVLEDLLPGLREEIYKAANFSYREELKSREEIVKGFLDRLSKGGK